MVTKPLKMTLLYYKYVCITNNESDTKSNFNPNNTTKQHAVGSIQLNIVTGSTYLEKFIRDNVIAQFLLLSVVTVMHCTSHCRQNSYSVPNRALLLKNIYNFFLDHNHKVPEKNFFKSGESSHMLSSQVITLQSNNNTEKIISSCYYDNSK